MPYSAWPVSGALLDLDEEVGLTYDVNYLISQWDDQSGNARHCTQSDPAKALVIRRHPAHSGLVHATFKPPPASAFSDNEQYLEIPAGHSIAHTGGGFALICDPANCAQMIQAGSNTGIIIKFGSGSETGMFSMQGGQMAMHFGAFRTLTWRWPCSLCLIVMTWDTGEMVLAVNGVEKTAAGATSATYTGGRIGRETSALAESDPAAGAKQYLGGLSKVGTWGSKLSPANRAALWAYAQARFGIGNTRIHVTEGDSIFMGREIETAAAPPLLMQPLYDRSVPGRVINPYVRYRFERNGSTLADMATEYATQAGIVKNQLRPTSGAGAWREMFADIHGGSNDIFGGSPVNGATAFTRLQTLGNLFKADGYRVRVWTILPRGTGSQAERNTFNALVRAGDASFDEMCDGAALPEAADSTNTTYYSDQIHPTSELARQMARLGARRFRAGGARMAQALSRSRSERDDFYRVEAVA